MGQVTPNIGIYIPAAGETNYDSSFAAGMVNIDQHDHSGGPNKGVPIATSGLADGSVTYNKLNANVADTTTGIGTNGAMPNQLQILGLLKNIYQLVTATGFLAKNGSVATARTIMGTAGQIDVANGDGSGGNPVISLDAAILPTAFVLIQTQSVTNVASVSFTGLSSAYTSYKLVFSNVKPVTNGGSLDLTVSNNGGSSYLNTGYQASVIFAAYNSTAPTVFNSDATTNLTGLSTSVSSSTGVGVCGSIEIFGAGTGTGYSHSGLSTNFDSNATLTVNNILSAVQTATGVNALQIAFDSGNIASGTFSLYGIKQ
jgi:hypothetical protein